MPTGLALTPAQSINPGTGETYENDTMWKNNLSTISTGTLFIGSTLINTANEIDPLGSTTYGNFLTYDSVQEKYVVNGANTVLGAVTNFDGTPSNPAGISIGLRTAVSGTLQNDVRGIAIGENAGRQMNDLGAIAIGWQSGFQMKNNTIAIGNQACGEFNTGIAEPGSIAIGANSALRGNGTNSIAIGNTSGQNGTNSFTVAIGGNAQNNVPGEGAIAIGYNAGVVSQGNNSIAIGREAGNGVNLASGAIVINGTGVRQTDMGVDSGFYVNPVRNISTSTALYYNPTTSEITYGAGGGGGGGGVNSVSAGTGITVTGTASDPVVNNDGVLYVSAGSGITIGGTAQNPEISASPSGIYTNVLYVNDGINDIQTAVDSATAGTQIVIGSGSYGGSSLTLSNKSNIALIAPPRGQGTIAELAGGRAFVLESTSTGSISVANLQIEGLMSIAGSGNNYFTNLETLNGITVEPGATGNYFFSNCEIAGLVQVSNTFTGVIAFTECNFQGATFILNNVSPLQVQFALCFNLPTSRPTNATYGSTNSDTSLVITTDTSFIRLAGDYGTAGQVLTSGGGSSAIWSTISSGGAGNIFENSANSNSVAEASKTTVSQGSIVLGNAMGADISAGSFNTVLGQNTLTFQSPPVTAPERSVVLGSFAGQQITSNMTIADGIVIGTSAMEGGFGFCNGAIVMGNNAVQFGNPGFFSIMLGRETGFACNTNETVMIGAFAGRSMGGGNRNVLIGFSAGDGASIGGNNVYIGQQTGLNTNGFGNVFIGSNVGQGTYSAQYTASNTTVIGRQSRLTPFTPSLPGSGYSDALFMDNNDGTTATGCRASFWSADPKKVRDAIPCLQVVGDFVANGIPQITTSFIISQAFTSIINIDSTAFTSPQIQGSFNYPYNHTITPLSGSNKLKVNVRVNASGVNHDLLVYVDIRNITTSVDVSATQYTDVAPMGVQVVGNDINSISITDYFDVSTFSRNDLLAVRLYVKSTSGSNLTLSGGTSVIEYSLSLTP
jgi:hypothetical protein